MKPFSVRRNLLATVSTIAFVTSLPVAPVGEGSLYVANNSAFAGEGCEGGEGLGHAREGYPWPQAAIYGCETDKWAEGGEGGEGAPVVVHEPVLHPPDADVHVPPVAPPHVSKELGGTLLGAAAGGLIGSEIGDGRGQMAAVGAGVFLGAILGSEIGRSLDRIDRLYAERTAHDALENAPTGETADWVNPDTGHAGTFTPTKTYDNARGQPCREYQTTVTIGGRTEQAYGTACRQADGSWKIVG